MFVSFALTITVMALAWFAWDALDSLEHIQRVESYEQVETLRDTIVHLDQLLTASAHLAVLTNESQWQDKYWDYKNKLDAAFRSIDAVAPTVGGIPEARITKAANYELLAIERDALNLLNSGQAEQAGEKLFSQEYAEQKARYAAGMEALTTRLNDITDKDLARRGRNAFARIIAGSLMIPLIVLAWALTFSAARSWITDQKKTNESLRFQAMLLDQIGDYVTATDLAGNINYVNAAQAKHLALTKEEIIGRPLEIYGKDDPKGPTQQEIRARTFADSQWQGEVVNYNTDGSQSSVNLRTWVVRDADGMPRGLAGVGRDVTEIKHAQAELQKAYDDLERRVTRRTEQLTKLNAELRDSEERYRAMFESSRDAIMTLAPPSWKFTSGNPATVEMFATKDEQEFIALAPWELSPEFQPDGERSVDKARQMIELAVRTGSHYFEWTHKRANGEEFPATVLLTRMELAGETFMQATVRDITASKRIQEALAESERRYRALFEGSSEGILVVDAETYELRYANPAVCRMLGYDSDGLTQRSVCDIHPPDELGHVLDIFRRQAKGELNLAPNIPCLRQDGTVFYADINSAFVIIDGRPCIVGFFTDITERQQAAAALKASEARYRQLVENLREGIAALDLTGKVTFVNKALTDIVGDSEESLLGADFFGATTAVQKEQFRSAFMDPNAPRGYYRVNFMRRDGQLIYLSVQGSPIFDDEGRHVGTLVVINDITQRHKAEESLKAAHRQLMYAGEQQRRALARDMHDSLGQQTVAMHLAIQELLTRAKRTDDYYVLQGLSRLSQACQSLTEDIRATCHGLFPTALEALGLCAAMRQLVRDCGNAIKVTTNCDEFPEDIRLEPDIEIALFRIAQEAITNVLRHSKAKNLDLRMTSEGGEVMLAITDDGVEFDVEKAGAAGLGLLTMRDRASAVGGSLNISSRPGRTSVVARIPTTPASKNP